MKSDWSLRVVRASVFAMMCVGVSAAGHIWMSGGRIPLWALGFGLEAAAGAGYAVAGRQRGFAAIAALMLFGQTVLHFLFAFAQTVPAAQAGSMSGMPDMAAPDMPATASNVMASVPGPACGVTVQSAQGCAGHGAAAMAMPAMAGHGTAGMVAAHAAAGLLCAWWLWCGEAAVFRLVGMLAMLAVPMLMVGWPRILAAPERRAVVPGECVLLAAPRRRVLAHVLVLRGPPTPGLCD